MFENHVGNEMFQFVWYGSTNVINFYYESNEYVYTVLSENRHRNLYLTLIVYGLMLCTNVRVT